MNDCEVLRFESVITGFINLSKFFYCSSVIVSSRNTSSNSCIPVALDNIIGATTVPAKNFSSILLIETVLFYKSTTFSITNLFMKFPEK